MDSKTEAKVRTLVDLAMTEKWTLLCGTILLLVSSMITMILPFGLGQIVDFMFKPTNTNTSNRDGVVGQSEANLTSICTWIIAVAGVQAMCTFIRSYIMEVASARITNRMKSEVFSAILEQEIDFFDKNQTGELINRLSSDTSQLSFCAMKNFSNGLKSLCQVIVGVWMMTHQSPVLTSISLTIMPAFAMLSILTGNYLKELWRGLQDELASATQIAQERISNIRTVRAFCQEALAVKTYQDTLANVISLATDEALIHSGFSGMAEFGDTIIVVSVLYFGGEMVTNQTISMGTLSSFMLHMVYVGYALHGLSSFYIQYMKGEGASARLWELISRTPSIPLTGGYIPTKVIDGALGFDNVSFSYSTRPDALVLQNITFDIPAGSMFAIVGPSGTGKSTLVSLILRFYDPTSGVIRLDGIDISSMNPEWLRQQIGTVSQEPVLFSGSIKDNILYGTRTPERVSDRGLNQVAEESSSLEFIQKFPDHFDTVVGERGVMLSGGQKQRIGIARALIKNPRILIFDEATSSLDAENEHLVQEALERVAKSRTVIIIAHRLSTIRNASKIAVVEDGKFAEVGTFDDLMTIPYGKFRKLVERQTI